MSGNKMDIHQMWDAYPALKEELNDVLLLIESYIRVRDSAIANRIKKMVHSGGKLLRPAYSLLCSHIGPNQDPDRSKAVAAALECLHMASLVHDDVIDKADIRHGQITIHEEYGNKVAIYTGDYLLSLAFSILSRYANYLPRIHFRGFQADKILAGELEQLHGRYQESVSIKRYLSQISGKTAQLFAMSCYTGAMASHTEQQIAAHAWRMGRYIGMAFQIIDDVLDYQGTSHVLGKPVMNDIRQGVYTLPLIYALKADAQTLRPLLRKRESITEEDLNIILECIRHHDGVEKATRLADGYTKKALDELKQLPSGSYKETLEQLTKALLERKM
ncbi:polyprenyl synthetase family protein [Sporolactobacillus laevolacticus]|uniref:polyprenyl synthetase family protein n=1 Tax=Sporolactobacillus laevolacticus TaxID=33018 RepID=UPI0033902801